MTTPALARPSMPVSLTDLAPISLADLSAQAELLTRVDRKYVVPTSVLPLWLERVAAGTRILEIDGRRNFAYRSCYWDTDQLDSFLTSGQGRRRRFKVRSRTYLDTGSTFLEVKTRGPRGTTVKERVLHPDVTGRRLDTVASTYVAHRLRAAAIDRVAPADLRPALVTTYRRATLVTPGGEVPVRATIDADLSWRLPEPAGAETANLAGMAVVETKGASTPSPFDRVLWRLGHRPVRISKYGTGLALLRDDVPDLKWHNVIYRHLTIERGERP
ncbi:MAG: polyphosphate polymerase domain-containing protein [Dermatophilaceae bacterium]